MASGLSQKSDVEQSESSNDEEDVLTFSTCVRYVKKLLTVYMGCAVENATHLYASHAGQALLACFPAAIQYEQQRFEVSGAKPADSGLLARETLACFLGFLRYCRELGVCLICSMVLCLRPLLRFAISGTLTACTSFSFILAVPMCCAPRFLRSTDMQLQKHRVG